jgi:MoaA/NifB/PqqE/SkfB family radical SAM enzyme
MNCSPEREESLNYNQIRNAICELHKYNPLKVVIFSGGEPTLLGEVLLDAIALADSLGIITRVVTNAHWATSPEKARAMLVALREVGLAELNISTDDYHVPYVPFDNIQNAWNASKELGFHAVVIANSWGPNSQINFEYIKSKLGENIPVRFNEKGRANSLGKPLSDGTIYLIANGYLQMIGRADKMATSNKHPAQVSRISGRCPWAGFDLALSPNNHLLACCGIEVKPNEILDLGDISRNSIKELIYQTDDNLLVNALALKGPMFLKNFIQMHDPDIPFRKQYSTMCELCENVIRNKEANKILLKYRYELAHIILKCRSELRDVQ